MIGETSMGAQEVQEVVQQLGSEYKGTSYHLLERNCNHFSNELCLKLTGRPAPSWVRLAYARCALLNQAMPSYATWCMNGKPEMSTTRLAAPEAEAMCGCTGQSPGWHGDHAPLPPANVMGAAAESPNCPASPRYAKYN